MAEYISGKRGYIAIGIDNYNKQNIPVLQGAINDAKEIAKILEEYGNFKDKKNCHLLLSNEATFENIRTAIHEIFWSPDPCEVVIFYFSGHGIVDGYGNGYIAPYDIDHDQPFVKGINMKEISRIITDYVGTSTETPKTVCMFLDCCHSGITMGGEKSGSDYSVDFVESAHTGLKGDGRVILVSSDANEKSRETGSSTHNGRMNPHYHGIFTSHMIDGLMGYAADNGVITVNALRGFVEGRMRGSNQKLRFIAEGGPRILDIRIAMESRKHEEYIRNMIARANQYNQQDIYSLSAAATCVSELSGYSLSLADARQLDENISKILQNYKQQILNWLAANRPAFRAKIDSIDMRLYGNIDNLDRYLTDVEQFVKIDDYRLCLLNTLCDIVNNPEFSDVDSFTGKCGACFRQFGEKTSAPTGYKPAPAKADAVTRSTGSEDGGTST